MTRPTRSGYPGSMRLNAFRLVVVILLCAAGCDDVTCPEGEAEGLCASAAPTEETVDGSWLEAHLDDAGLQILDVRSGPEFEAERIPGAIYLDDGLLRDTVMGVSGQVASAVDVEAALAAAGVREDARLIVYSTSLDTSAARVWWTLLLYAHADTQVLDGGFSAWLAASRPTEAGALSASPSSYQVGATDESLRVDVDFVEAHLDDPDVILVDARSASEYAAGHIPGALNVDWNANVDGGSLRPVAELEPLYAGIEPSATVVTYCQTGSRGSVAFLVLRSLGFTDVRLYDGSWAEWGSDPMLPVE